MGQIQSIESHDKCPQLARKGQALTMKFSTYLPACALYNRENTAQINIHRSQSPPLKAQTHCKALWETIVFEKSYTTVQKFGQSRIFSQTFKK